MTRTLAGMLAASLLLASCAYDKVSCTDLAKGACDVTTTRLLTDSGVTLTTPDNLHLDFTSKPDQAGTQAAINALAGVVTASVPKPAAPPAKSSTPEEPLVAPMADPASDPLLELGRHVGPGGHVRYLEAVDRRSACWRSDRGTEHCGTVADWLTWASAR